MHHGKSLNIGSVTQVSLKSMNFGRTEHPGFTFLFTKDVLNLVVPSFISLLAHIDGKPINHGCPKDVGKYKIA